MKAKMSPRQKRSSSRIAMPSPAASSSKKISHDQGSDRFRFKRADKISTSAVHRDWLIEGVVKEQSIVTVLGAPQACKTAVVLEMAASIATGIPWQGLQVKRGRVLLIAGEGHDGFSLRLRALEVHRNFKLKNAPFMISETGMSFLNTGHVDRLVNEIDRLGGDDQRTPTLIIIDTLARNFGGGDENSATDMGQFLEHVCKLRDRYKCAVMIVHHTGHANRSRARGSSALYAGIDLEMTLDRKEESVVIHCTKYKDQPKFEPIALRIKEVDLRLKKGGEEVLESTFVMERTEVPLKNPPVKQLAALKILKQMLSEVRLQSAHASHPGVAVRLWKERVLRDAVVNGTKPFDRLKERLVGKKLIRIDKANNVTLRA